MNNIFKNIKKYLFKSDSYLKKEIEIKTKQIATLEKKLYDLSEKYNNLKVNFEKDKKYYENTLDEWQIICSNTLIQLEEKNEIIKKLKNQKSKFFSNIKNFLN